MQPRIRAFDNVYRVRLQERLFAVGPDQDLDDHRAYLAYIPPPVRQTNRQPYNLPPALLQDLQKAAEELYQAKRDSGFTVIGFTVNDLLATMVKEAREEAEEGDI